jgi:3-hydroxyisobutyrate dehydrogenase-like beta-hydroxyacid dehydrogenase
MIAASVYALGVHARDPRGDVLSAWRAGSFSINNLGPRIVKRNFQPGFYTDHFIKDLGACPFLFSTYVSLLVVVCAWAALEARLAWLRAR